MSPAEPFTLADLEALEEALYIYAEQCSPKFRAKIAPPLFAKIAAAKKEVSDDRP